MKKLILIAALLASTSAFAQEEKAPEAPKATEQPKPAPAPPNPGPFFFLLDMQDLNVIATGLNEVVKKNADPLLQKLNAQILAQDEIKKAAGK